MEVSSKPLSSSTFPLEPQFGSNKAEAKKDASFKAEQDKVTISAEAYAALAENKDGVATTLGTGVTPPPPPPPPPPPGSEPVED